MLNRFNLYKQSINQIFSIKFISVIIISIPSAVIADYFNIPLAWMLGTNDRNIYCSSGWNKGCNA
jgi:uncharacterized membrane protein AbrB (regulator of aidB expression)